MRLRCLGQKRFWEYFRRTQGEGIAVSQKGRYAGRSRLLAAKSATAIVPCVFERRPLIFRINRLHIGKAIEVPDKGTISEKTEDQRHAL